MAYMKTKMGPGDIAALPPTIGLSNRPTISANDMPRTISGLSPRPYAPPPMSGCSGCSAGLSDIVTQEQQASIFKGILILGAVAAVGYLVIDKVGDRVNERLLGAGHDAMLEAKYRRQAAEARAARLDPHAGRRGGYR